MEAATYKWKYLPTAETDYMIRDAYSRQRMGDRSALKAISRELGWTRSAVCKRGAELGVARVKEKSWSEEEKSVLEQFGHLAQGIQRKLSEAGYARTIAAIQVKLNRDRIKSNLEGYSACQLAGALGLEVRKVLRWIQQGYLKAERRGTGRTPQQGGDMWWIPDRNVRRFVLRFPQEIDLARVEKIWFLNLLTDGKLCARLSY